METTTRINVILILFIAIICFFVVRETLFHGRLSEDIASISQKIKTGGSSVLGAITGTETLPAQSTPLSDQFAATVPIPDDLPPPSPVPPPQQQPVQQPAPPAQPDGTMPIPNESRLFRVEPESRQQLAFTKTQKGTWLAPPQGFFSALTNSYLVYREDKQISADLKKALDTIHGNFILDVIPFSVFSKFDRIFLMMFNNRGTYSNFTSMPEWSIATTDIDAQAIYIMENKDFRGYFVHELSHIYYDGFFKPTISPLWLSEGFAVRMQAGAQENVEKNWLDKEALSFKKGEYITFNEFINTENLGRYSSQDVLTWYAQAYSVVDYLLRRKDRDEFYQFSKNLKEGQPIGAALYRAYGMPFNNINALEYAWQADLQKDMGGAK